MNFFFKRIYNNSNFIGNKNELKENASLFNKDGLQQTRLFMLRSQYRKMWLQSRKSATLSIEFCIRSSTCVSYDGIECSCSINHRVESIDCHFISRDMHSLFPLHCAAKSAHFFREFIFVCISDAIEPSFIHRQVRECD